MYEHENEERQIQTVSAVEIWSAQLAALFIFLAAANYFWDNRLELIGYNGPAHLVDKVNTPVCWTEPCVNSVTGRVEE